MENVIEHNFQDVSNAELMEVEGGLIITGMMVAAGIGCLAGGVAVGYAVGTIIKNW
ncbi:class IIb bacteriocin, lactobin A/cerein 7B family [Bacillus alkalicellulosilyticus]|uniref:class IIb bacteriocin, lactobin A/cerein 7B family n=1 Tax=Alkalihalobacterium alkalicellulosilyticum TaxID=1912214 RepID=UPI000998CA4A|nr:class IIb bacteriocin, lactobin A/cerein 7B family [Bacillus alkalicellulosilyticus]